MKPILWRGSGVSQAQEFQGVGPFLQLQQE